MAFGKLRTNMRFWKYFIHETVLLLPPMYSTYMALAMADCGAVVLLARVAGLVWRGGEALRVWGGCGSMAGRGLEGQGWPGDEGDRPWKLLAGDRKDEMRNGSNGDGFTQTSILWCREWWGLPLRGGGWRRDATVSPEKLAEEFVGNLSFPNFGVRSRSLRVAAAEKGCTSRNLSSRRTPACICI
jgi:hypothetical protein